MRGNLMQPHAVMHTAGSGCWRHTTLQSGCAGGSATLHQQWLGLQLFHRPTQHSRKSGNNNGFPCRIITILKHLGHLTCALCGNQVRLQPCMVSSKECIAACSTEVLLPSVVCTQIADASNAIAMTQDGVASAFVNAHGARHRAGGCLWRTAAALLAAIVDVDEWLCMRCRVCT
jgi:hypothetical protein